MGDVNFTSSNFLFMANDSKNNPARPVVTDDVRAYFSALGKRSKGGGRPRIPDSQMTEAQRKRRARYERAKSGSAKRVVRPAAE